MYKMNYLLRARRNWYSFANLEENLQCSRLQLQQRWAETRITNRPRRFTISRRTPSEERKSLCPSKHKSDCVGVTSCCEKDVISSVVDSDTKAMCAWLLTSPRNAASQQRITKNWTNCTTNMPNLKVILVKKSKINLHSEATVKYIFCCLGRITNSSIPL